MQKVVGVVLALTLAGPAMAQDMDEARFGLGGDAYMAGETVTLDETGRDDAFMAGETVRLGADIAGTAHLAGRWVEVTAEVGDSLYAAGQRVTVRGAVAQDATLAGQYVAQRGAVGGDLRIFGSEVEVTAPIAGSLLLAGEFVEFDAEVQGDAAMSARSLTFGAGARVGGTLILFEEDPGTLEVPESVAAADRIDRRQIGEWDSARMDFVPEVRPLHWLGSFLMGVVIVALVAAAFALVAPQTVAGLRRTVLESPGRGLLAGFVAVSALAGASVVLGLTLIGLLLVPAAVLLTLAAGLLGYIVGAYAAGVGLLGLFGRDVPHSHGDRALAAATGALAVGLVGLIPIVGWIVVLLLSLAGAGAVVLRTLRPAFFVADPA